MAFLLVIHLLLAVALIGVVLIQKSEGGALGIGGGGGGFMSARGAANFLTRTTGILAGLFMLTSLALTFFAHHGDSGSIVDRIEQQQAPTIVPSEPAAPAVPNGSTPAPAPASTAPAAPAPATDSAPAPAAAPSAPPTAPAN